MKKHYSVLSVVALSSVALSGCLGGSDSEQPKVSYSPLTSDQKQLALDTYQSATLGSAAAASLNPQYTAGIPGTDAASQTFVKMSDLLKASAQSGDCATQSHSSTSLPNTDESFGISGAHCEISYSTTNQSTNGFGTFSDIYRVLDTNYLTLNDVDSYSFSGTQTVTSASSAQAFTFAIHGSGSFHSQKMGELNLTMDGTASLDLGNNSGSGHITMQAQFPGFTAVLEETTSSQSDGSTSTSYVLNGVPLTADEVSTYLQPAFAPKEKSGTPHVLGFNIGR